MLNFIMSLFILLYFMFTLYTVAMRLLGKKMSVEPEHYLGRAIWIHGEAWIWFLCFSAVITFCFLASNIFMSLLVQKGIITF